MKHQATTTPRLLRILADQIELGQIEALLVCAVGFDEEDGEGSMTTCMLEGRGQLYPFALRELTHQIERMENTR